MPTLRDMIAYICAHNPSGLPLSKTRLTKLIYLADWRSALVTGHQLTNIQWEFNHYGPYVPDVIREARNSPGIEVVQTQNSQGSLIELVKADKDVEYASVTRTDTEVLDFVLKTYSAQPFQEFVRLVYSTYPIMTQKRYSKLDLAALAKAYKALPEP